MWGVEAHRLPPGGEEKGQLVLLWTVTVYFSFCLSGTSKSREYKNRLRGKRKTGDMQSYLERVLAASLLAGESTRGVKSQ